MRIAELEIDALQVNPANDRHGELHDETAAIAQLFRLRENHMKALAADITAEGRVYDPPLVWEGDGENIVYDGNRRVTCLKLIRNPDRAPTQDLQAYFAQLAGNWDELPTMVECEIETDRDVIDAMLFRRHTGSQGGIGQSTWDDRAKRNFVERTGKGGRIEVADEIERILTENDKLPERQIPRSTVNRLLSSELNRNRVGLSVSRNRFALTHELDAVLPAIERLATDMANRDIVLADVWDNEGKRAYLNRLENDELLPGEDSLLPEQEDQPRRRQPRRRGRPAQRRGPNTLIPANTPQPPWDADQARVRAIWDELCALSLMNHPNAVSALFRILLELGITGYLERNQMRIAGELSTNFRRAYESLLEREIIDRDYADELARMRQDELISIRSMQRYVHSPEFAPMAGELQTYWTRLGRFLIHAVSD
ncbi:MAG: hypothetical protein ACSHW2_00930 [Parasphingopyxis sp.]